MLVRLSNLSVDLGNSLQQQEGNCISPEHDGSARYRTIVVYGQDPAYDKLSVVLELKRALAAWLINCSAVFFFLRKVFLRTALTLA